jgi:23S rRNA U2552 (ribose-2'-O)-methylase RlmE/FtsJ
MSLLSELGKKHGTDKVDGGHTLMGKNYCDIYDFWFAKKRNEVKKFVEIGIRGGQSLRMWKDYFPNAEIIGIDIDPQCMRHQEERITCIIGDQNDDDFLSNVKEQIGEYDILLDDGSHITKHQIKTFDCLYENCRSGGFYVIEDLSNSYEEVLNHHDIRTHWDGMKYNKPEDSLKNFRVDFDDFIKDKVKDLDMRNILNTTGKMCAIHHYPYIVIFENAE